MKNTGIVRRIDDLGRIVIPKEIRNVLKINNSDELEIFIDNNMIVLKKYSLLGTDKDKSNDLLEMVDHLVDGLLLITDKDKIITKGEYEDLKISSEIKKIIDERQIYCSEDLEVFLFDNVPLRGYYYISPIITDSIARGCIFLIKNNKINKEDEMFVRVLKNIIEKSS